MPRIAATDDAEVTSASGAQLRYIQSLLDQKDTTTLLQDINSRPLGPVDPTTLTGGRSGTASALIEWLTRRPSKIKLSVVPDAPAREITEGLWVQKFEHDVDDGYADGELVAYLVQPTKNGLGWNVKEWLPPLPGDDDGDWTYIGGTASLPAKAHPATKDEAIAFATAFGRCSECGRVLTVKESRAASMGPKCAGKLDAR